jgi:uncharacterized protein (TIGR03083 family)
MTTRTFVAWVEPIATQLRGTREQIAPLAAQVPPDDWSKESAYRGWTYKDQLAHLAVSHWAIQTVLRSIVGSERPDMSFFDRIDEINEEHRRQRQSRSIDQLLTEARAEGEETEALLSRLTDQHAALKFGPPMTLGQVLNEFTAHDIEHLDQLRKALS